MHVVLISPYELGRQPFGLAEPAAWLRSAGFEVSCLDLSLDTLEPGLLRRANLVCLYLAMHTATRIAVEALPRLRELAPDAHLCAYGLYAPVNAEALRGLGIETILGGESEPDLLALAQALAAGHPTPFSAPVVNLGKVDFLVPDRTGLPPLQSYARLVRPDGIELTCGFVEASRGCKHLCRHCPVVPVYAGRFRIVPVEVVLEDVARQVEAGAEHISFGDPDFFNGPTHARRVVEAMHDRFPSLTYDATVKVEHIVKRADLLPVLQRTGCLFLTTAVESIEDHILEHLLKQHTAADFELALALLREHRIAMAPTFVAFSPWTTIDGYLRLLDRIAELRLVESVSPVQLSIRLLVPQGSRLLELPGFRALIGDYDPALLGYPWRHQNPRVDALQARVQGAVAGGESDGSGRSEIFTIVWRLAHEAADRRPGELSADLGEAIPRHSEPWYCCAEPTSQQLQAF